MHRALSAAHRRGIGIAVLLGLAFAAALPAAADVALFAPEINLVAATDGGGDWRDSAGAQRTSIGFESYGRRSGDLGDFLAWDLQVRLSHDSTEPTDDTWSIEIHNAWIEYRIALGRRVRVGHFSPAFGLEHDVDTHATLLQTLAGRDIGFKKDWGIAYQTAAGPFDATLAVQLGSGAPVAAREGSHLTTMRLATPPGRGSRFGASLLAGHVLETRGARTWPASEAPTATSKLRVGLDGERSIGPVRVSGEVTVGRDEDAGVVGALLWADLAVPLLRDLTIETQGRTWSDDRLRSGSRRTSAAVGASLRMTAHCTLRAVVERALEAPRDEPNVIAFQIYYYGG